MKTSIDLENAVLTVLAEEKREDKHYALLELCFGRCQEWLLYAEDKEEASCVFLPHELYSEGKVLLQRIADGELSPLQLSDVVEDAIDSF